MLVALAGGLLGVLLVFLVINNMVGPALEQGGGLFAYFHAPGWLMALALAIAMIVGLLAGLIPAIRTSRSRVVDALRRVN